MKKSTFLLIVVVGWMMTGCTEDEPVRNPVNTSGSSSQPEWLIPEGKVLDGGPGKDGIPAISNPKFAATSETVYLQDNDLVIGFKSGGVLRAYPHRILDWHEIVNDQIEETVFAVTYCPLTGTAINWNRKVEGTTTTFGVSGLLFNSNLIPYDRGTDSNWSQMLLKCVNGQLQGTDVSVFPVIETTWKTWKELYPESEVMTLETGFNRNYATYPYLTFSGDYRTEDYLLFPVENSDNRLPAKERVHGIIVDETVKVYRFDEFKEGIQIVEDFMGTQKVAVVGSEEDNFIVSFNINEQILVPSESGPALFEDQNGNTYNLFGEVVEGPDIGVDLTPTTSFMGYWFSWPAFYPKVDIYNF